MATQAWKDQRIANAKKARKAAVAKRDKAAQAIADAEAQIAHLDNVMGWLEAMPVDDAPETETADEGDSA